MIETFKIYSLNNFKIYNTTLLTIVTRVLITSPGLTYLVTGNLYLLTTFTHFCLPPTPCFWQPPTSSLYLWVSFFLGSTSKCNHAVFVFLWLTSFSVTPLRPSSVVTNDRIFFFNKKRNNKLYIDTCIHTHTHTTFSLSVYLLRGIYMLFTHLSCCKESCSEHGSAHILLRSVSFFCMWLSSFPNITYWRDCPSPLCILGSFVIIIWPYMCGFISGFLFLFH